MGMGGGTGIGKGIRMTRTIAGLDRAKPYKARIETNHGEQLIYMGTREGAYRFVGRKKGIDSAILMEVQPNDMHFTRGELTLERYVVEQYNPEEGKENREFCYTQLDAILHEAQL